MLDKVKLHSSLGLITSLIVDEDGFVIYGMVKSDPWWLYQGHTIEHFILEWVKL